MVSIADIDSAVQDEIEKRLKAIEAQHDVRFLLAVESGSRAWGFPSPDSDYDVRFIYVRSLDGYLSIKSVRDVIETPLVDLIDLNGWDIRKALGLMLKSNVIVSEWLESPIRYRPDDDAIEGLREMADLLFEPAGAARHYSSLGRNAAERWLEGSEPVPVKRYFYALRPALALRFMRHSAGRRPPMNLQELQAASDLPEALNAIIDELVELKRVTNEKSNARRYRELDDFIGKEIELVSQKRPTPSAQNTERADQFFKSLVTPRSA